MNRSSAPVFMGRLCAVAQPRGSAGVISCGLAALVLWTLLPLYSQDSASLRGTIRDAQGKALAGVSIQLRAKDASSAQVVHSDAQGAYSFAALHSGVYALRAELAGYAEAEIPALFLGPKERVQGFRLQRNRLTRLGERRLRCEARQNCTPPAHPNEPLEQMMRPWRATECLRRQAPFPAHHE